MFKIFSLTILCLTLTLQSCILYKKYKKCGPTRDYAIKYIDEHIKINDSTNYSGILISKRKALVIAKKSIFEKYGYWHINLHERPFKKYFIDRYLYLSGTICSRGGVFYVVVDRQDGEIKVKSHSK